MRLTIDVKNRAGLKQGPGPIYTATDFEYTRRLNRAGSFRFRVPKRDDRTDLVYSTIGAKASVVEMQWDGATEFRGIVEKLHVTADNQNNLYLQVEGRDMLAELAEVPVGFLDCSGYKITHDGPVGSGFVFGETVVGGTSGATGAVVYENTAGSPFYLTLNPIFTEAEFQAGETLTGVTSGTTANSVTVIGRTGIPNAPARILSTANLLTPDTWALDTTNGYGSTASDIYAKFAGESALAALIKVAEHIGERFRMGSGLRQLVWLQDEEPTPVVRAIQGAGDPVAAETNDAICFIQDLSEIQDAYELVNRVYAWGSGVGDVRLTMNATTRTPPAGYSLNKPLNYLQNSDSVAALGAVIAKYVEFKDVRPIANTDQDISAASDALYDAVFAWMQQRDDVSDNKAYDLSVIKLPSTVNPGDRIRVIYEDDRYDIDETFYILEITTRIDQSGSRTHRLTISTTDGYPATDGEIQAQQIERGTVLSAHPQMNANSYRENFRAFVGEDQTSEKAEIRWWFGPEVVQLQQVLWRFNLTEMVAPSQTVGGTTTTTESGGGSTVSSAGGSSHSHSVPGHTHQITLPHAASLPGDVGISNAGGLFYTGTDFGDRTVNTDSGTGGTTSASESSHSHDVSIPAHTHDIDISGAISTDFGIFRESAANTFSISDLEYQVNGGGWVDLSGAVTSHGSGWYSVDITSDIQQPTTFRPSQEGNLLEVRRKTAGATGKTAMLDGALEVRNIIQAIAFT